MPERKSAIVTGAGAGIGAAIASRAGERGYRVGVLDLDAEAAESTAAAIEGAVALTANVANQDEVEAALDLFGEPPALVVNKVQRGEHHFLGTRIEGECREYLGTDLRHAGSLARDEEVEKALQLCEPVFSLFPGCFFSTGLAELADRLLRARETSSSTSIEVSPSPVAESERSVLGSGALPPLDVSEPGAYLRRCRKRQGLGISDIYRDSQLSRDR